MSTLLRRSISGLAAFVLALLSVFVFSSTPGVSASGFVFTIFELSSTPSVTCPGGGASCTNNAAEPQIRADMAGHFYASSENGLGAGTQAWRSTDSGRHYTALASPNAVSQGAPVAPGGGDTDLATAPAKNGSGNYTVYVASLNLANIDVSTSMDAGKTWKLNPTSATVPGDDREWIAADQASKVCISYHDVATFNIDVNCSYDAGTTFTQLGEAFDPTHAFLAQNNAIGNLVIDPRSHIIYQTFSGIANAGEVACSQAGSCGYHVVWVAVSTDGGKTFTDHVIYNNPDTTVSYGHQFVNMSVDRGGNVYSVYSDNHNVSYSFSTTHATTWSAPTRVNSAPSNTAIMPWSIANQAGHIDIVWYGTSYSDGTTQPDTYPMSAAWYVYFAQNLKATTAGSSFSQMQPTPIIHYGGVCEGGISCTGNRDLYDDFGIAANPLTGMASIVYSDDQYTNDPNNPPQTGCTPSSSNSSTCNHTSIATQTSGTGI
ncbi:hypothetical protein KSC_027980 [Ktedonobacter sp. SOSP1-52]|uniref:hypothetical protein n=1 Tax=Ktedonobacter sp. SOSP1-52 TaxID=2778366 RepID=UPI001915C17D|nr:hypothetical protein [Ktedonobacter sp. SOSP1-52]GHO63906.1 hypothetical protein KSC_027980 [Ktedonobacter sp. SOSP1-52]